jgi:hypothetical protein
MEYYPKQGAFFSGREMIKPREPDETFCTNFETRLRRYIPVSSV